MLLSFMFVASHKNVQMFLTRVGTSEFASNFAVGKIQWQFWAVQKVSWEIWFILLTCFYFLQISCKNFVWKKQGLQCQVPGMLSDGT